MISSEYWGVKPGFMLISDSFYIRNELDKAMMWCIAHCKAKFIASAIQPWAFQSEEDAQRFAQEFNGMIRYKPEEII